MYLFVSNTKQKMAKAKGSSTVSTRKIKPKVSRPGVHAKTKSSKSKNSKNYKKLYKGQG
jgi:hypothetical protein